MNFKWQLCEIWISFPWWLLMFNIFLCAPWPLVELFLGCVDSCGLPIWCWIVNIPVVNLKGLNVFYTNHQAGLWTKVIFFSCVLCTFVFSIVSLPILFVILFVCFWNWVLGRSGCLELFMQPKVTLISWEAPTSQVLQLQGWTTRESLTVSSEKFLIWTMFRLSIYKKNLRIKRLHPKEICIGIIFYKQYAWVWLILLLNNICICTWYILTILIFYHHHLPYYPSLPLIFPTNLFPMSISIHFLFCDLVMGS